MFKVVDWASGSRLRVAWARTLTCERPCEQWISWFDYSCPYAYLGSTQVEGLASRTGARLAWRPMLLGGVFAANGTPQKLFATLSAAKAAHNARDSNDGPSSSASRS